MMISRILKQLPCAMQLVVFQGFRAFIFLGIYMQFINFAPCLSNNKV